jgi:hypothetical protein
MQKSYNKGQLLLDPEGVIGIITLVKDKHNLNKFDGWPPSWNYMVLWYDDYLEERAMALYHIDEFASNFQEKMEQTDE